jgi:hypothetical protein
MIDNSHSQIFALQRKKGESGRDRLAGAPSRDER